MNKASRIIAIGLLALAPVAWAIPSSITYQGNLKQQGLPTSGTKNMLFRITNSDGSQVYWSSGNMSVTVTNGLFSAHITPTGVDWQHVTPYVEVSVEGQLLQPREPVNATVYATISNGVVNGSITPASVSSGYGLIPAGMIAMFATACPSGWSRFSALDNAFPMGATSYGTIGGSDTHVHSISTDGAHSHSGATGQGAITGTRVVNSSGQNTGGELIQDMGTGGSYSIRLGTHDHSISTDGAHNHGGTTGSASSLPPYITMVYCQKQ